MQKTPQWTEIREKIVEIISRFPELERTTKWGSDVFTYKGKNVVSYGGFKNFFSIWFFNGVFFDDKYGVLVSASEGKTKSLRQWRFTTADQVDEQKVREYIQQAIEAEEKGLRIEPSKFTAAPIPEFLSEILKNDPALHAAFNGLSPGKQKEYILYLNEAKQESTRTSRLNKIIPLILDGKGLNDKYKKN